MSALFNVGRLIKEEIRESNCLQDFPYADFEVLKFLNDKENITMRPIADYLHIKPSSVTPLIENLVKSGHLKRIYGKADRRAIYIKLTPKGLKFLEKKYKNTHKTIRKVFGKLNNKDKRDLVIILEKIIHDKHK